MAQLSREQKVSAAFVKVADTSLPATTSSTCSKPSLRNVPTSSIPMPVG